MTSGRDASVTVVLLRHGQVPNHRSDVGLTELGIAQATAAGRWLAEEGVDIAALLSGETRRTRDTAAIVADGFRSAGGAVDDPEVSFALRNPDIYLGGHRVNMGQGLAFFADQVDALSEDDIDRHPFFHGFVTAPDRIGYWLEHPDPPGEVANDVGVRIVRFARSLADVPAWSGRTIVAITHSPVLRALRYHHWGDYSAEPPFLHGYRLAIHADSESELTTFTTDTGDIAPTAKPGPGVLTGADATEETE